MKRVLILCVFLLLCSPILSVSAATSNPQKKATFTYQYAGASFDPENTYSWAQGKPKVFEKGEYTIVFWVDSILDQSLYMSVAKKNKWLFRGKKVYNIPDDYSSISANYIFANNYLFYADKTGLNLVVFNLDNGSVVSQKLLEQKESPDTNFNFDYKTFSQIKTTDRMGVLYGPVDNGVYKLYLENEISTPIVIKDPKEVLKSHYGQMILSAKRDRILFMNNLYTNVFNIKQNDMIYDSAGQDKNFKIGTNFWGTVRVYANGKIFLIENNKGKTLISTYDDNFKKLNTYQFNQVENYFYDIVTFSNSSLHIWDYYDYKRSNSLKLVNYNFQ